MLAHYSHVRLEAKRNALEALAADAIKPSSEHMLSSGPTHQREVGYDTTNDTKDQTIDARWDSVSAELIETNGRPEWTRTIDLFRVK